MQDRLFGVQVQPAVRNRILSLSSFFPHKSSLNTSELYSRKPKICQINCWLLVIFRPLKAPGGNFSPANRFFIATSDFFVKLHLCIPVWEMLSSYLCGRVVSRIVDIDFSWN